MFSKDTGYSLQMLIATSLTYMGEVLNVCKCFLQKGTLDRCQETRAGFGQNSSLLIGELPTSDFAVSPFASYMQTAVENTTVPCACVYRLDGRVQEAHSNSVSFLSM